MTQSIIKSSEATLKTLSVTINTLAVNDRQMTMSVFRQLPTAKLVDGSAIFGDAWGKVRYKIGAYTLWVVVEKDGVLYRCPYPLLWRLENMEEYIERSELEWKRIENDTVIAYRKRCLDRLPQLFISV